MRGNWSKEPCVECGNEGLASRGEEVVDQGPYTCSECSQYNKAFDAGYEAGKDHVRIEQANLIRERTKDQHFSNAMLTMRRVMKFIGIARRLETYWNWCDSDRQTPKPEVSNEDTTAYLYSAGVTEKTLNQSLERLLLIVNHYVETK